MINIVNRFDNDDSTNASHSRGMRFWSPEWVAREMHKLADMRVKTLRISDEMFFLNRKYYLPILDDCIQSEYGFNMWTYSRIDTVRANVLEKFKKAGVNWLALGIEAGQSIGAPRGFERDLSGGQHPRGLQDDPRLRHQHH